MSNKEFLPKFCSQPRGKFPSLTKYEIEIHFSLRLTAASPSGHVGHCQLTAARRAGVATGEHCVHFVGVLFLREFFAVLSENESALPSIIVRGFRRFRAHCPWIDDSPRERGI